MSRNNRFVLLLLLTLAFTASHAQWQTLGSEQLPDPIEVGEIRAADSTGLDLADDAGTVALSLEDGGQIGIVNTSPDVDLHLGGLTGSGDKTMWLTAANGSNSTIGMFETNTVDPDRHGVEWVYDGAANKFYLKTVLSTVRGTIMDWDIVTSDVGVLGEFVFGGDSALRLGYDTGSNQFEFGSSNTLQIDADDGGLTSDGNVDFAGEAEFGDSSNTVTYYQSASEFASTDSVEYDPLTDGVNPSTTGADVYLAVPCPWSTPNTRIKSAKFVVYLDSNAEAVNFSIRRQTTAAPGTTTDVVSLGGSDYDRLTGMTSISGGYYYRTNTCSYTIANNEKVWAIVKLYADATKTDCRFVGIEWTFEQRTY